VIEAPFAVKSEPSRPALLLQPAMAQEFTIRAAGADKAALRHLVCRFPLAFRPDAASEATAQAPDLKRAGESWAMGQMEDAEARPGTRGCERRRRAAATLIRLLPACLLALLA
jgi:hypothetical protein